MPASQRTQDAIIGSQLESVSQSAPITTREVAIRKEPVSVKKLLQMYMHELDPSQIITSVSQPIGQHLLHQHVCRVSKVKFASKMTSSFKKSSVVTSQCH